MKISEVIKELEKASQKHGDVDCIFMRTADSAGKRIYMHDLTDWRFVEDPKAADYICIELH
jgi:hypothetical protein